MAQVNVKCVPKSLAGPVDPRVVRWLKKRGLPLDPVFLEHVKKFHGGVPVNQYFTVPVAETFEAFAAMLRPRR